MIMASIYVRNNRFYVIYSYYDEKGMRKQKWETYKTMVEATKRKKEVEYKRQIDTSRFPSCATLSELLTEYVSLYGKARWSISVYGSNKALIKHYIEPHLGSMQLIEITAYTLEKYYHMLLTTPAVRQSNMKKHCEAEQHVTPATVRRIHSLLRSALKQAEKWKLIDKNPAQFATVPKHDERPQEIWDAPTLFRALECCQDKRLKLCMNLAFACSLRLGELLGLTWDCVDVSEESIQAGSASISITKALQRVNKEALKELESKDTIAVFPEQSIWSKSVLVLKKAEDDKQYP